MPKLEKYGAFNGRHWETGSVANYFDYCGVKAPHTGQPISEALLLGVSGGAVMGYFTFHYEGYDPQVNILTRNTFDPFETMLSRLGVVQHIERTASAHKAEGILTQTLEEGVPAIVWADLWSLDYNAVAEDDGMWAMFPVVVYGHDGESAAIADRAKVGLTASAAELQKARSRVKKDKHKLQTLEPPNWDKLKSAVQMGIHDCIKLYTEKPPRGAKDNFGLAAYQAWAKALRSPKGRKSWAKLFKPGRPLFAALTSAFTFSQLFGKATPADRALYADFLAEAAVILERPALAEAAAQFRAAGEGWAAVGRALLPDAVAPLREGRELLAQRHALFLEQGNGSVAARWEINGRLDKLRATMETDFPLDAAGIDALFNELAARIMAVHDVEAAAVAALREEVS